MGLRGTTIIDRSFEFSTCQLLLQIQSSLKNKKHYQGHLAIPDSARDRVEPRLSVKLLTTSSHRRLDISLSYLNLYTYQFAYITCCIQSSSSHTDSASCKHISLLIDSYIKRYATTGLWIYMYCCLSAS